MRLIDADALMPNAEYKGRYDVVTAYDIANAPTIDPERKKGKWRRRLVDCGFNADWHCSECGWKTSLEEHGYNYCPNCGSYNGGEQE